MLGQEEKSALRAAFAAPSAIIRKSITIALRCIAILCFTAALAACSNGPIGGSTDAMQQASAAAQSYSLGAGDKIHVTVFNEDNLSGDYVIAPDGRITLPLAGGLQAAGLTIP